MNSVNTPPNGGPAPAPSRPAGDAASPMASGHRISRLMAKACAVGVLALGAVGLADALTGQRLFGGIILPLYIPMAVSTALLFVFFGGVLALPMVGRRGGRSALKAAILVATVLSSKEGLEYLFRLPPTVLEGHYDRLLALVSPAATPMSPLTSALFVLAGAATWLFHSRPGPDVETLRNDTAGCLGVAIGFVSLTLLGGYLHGRPYLYGTDAVPVALTTSAAFLLLGLGIVAVAGPRSLFLRAFFGDSTKARLMRTFPPLVAAMFLFHPAIEILVSAVFQVDPDLLFSLQVTTLAALTATGTAFTVRVVGVSIDRETELRQKAEAKALRELRVNKAQAEIAEALIRPGMTMQHLAGILYRAVTHLVGCRHAFVSTIDPESGDNIGHTIAALVANGKCGVDRNSVFRRGVDGVYPGLWGHALNTLEGFYTNAPVSHPAATGLPEGHVPLERFLSVPVRYEQQLVGQISLANPMGDFTQEDLDTVQILADLFALGVYRIRSEQEILAAKEGLAETVRQRTRELEATNARLKREVAEREMFQGALKESATLFRAVVEDQTEFICRFKPDGTILFANNAYARCFGRSPDELTGQAFFTFLTPQVQDQVRSLLDQITLENPVQTHEHTVLTPAGDLVWHSWTYRGVFDPAGRLEAFQAVGRDITRAKRSEQALLDHKERLEEKVRERTIQLEERTRSILRINEDLQEQIATRQQAEEALSRSARDLQAKVRQITCLYELSDVLGDGSLDMDRMLGQAVGKIPAGWGGPESAAAELVVDGQPRRSPGYREGGPCLRRELLVFGEARGRLTVCGLCAPGAQEAFPDDELDLFSSVAHQIERALESRLSQDMLVLSERKFRDFFDNAADAVFVHDLDGRILDANRSAGAWLGVSPESLRGTNLLHLAREADRQAMSAQFGHAASGLPALFRASLERADKAPIPVEFNCLAMDYHGEPALVSSARDIAKRLQAENEILRRMQAEALLAGISEHLLNASTEEFSAAFERSLGELGQALEMEHVAVFTYVRGVGRFRRALRWRAMDQKPLGRGIKGFGQRLTTMLLERLSAQETVVIHEAARMPAGSEGAVLLAEAGIQGFVAVPMSLRGQLLGVLLLGRTGRGLPRDFVDLGLLDNVALLLANAQERQRADISLRESERLARSIIESLGANICVVDRKGVLTMVNRAWELFARENTPAGKAAFGVGANYLDVCRNAAEAGQPLAAEAVEGIAGVLSGRMPVFNLEYDCHSPSEQRWFNMQVVPFSQGGRGAVISHRDITARVLASQDVRKSEERYRIIVETAQEGVLSVDAESRITYANPRMLSMLGYESRELTGLALPEIIEPEDLEMVREQQMRQRQGFSGQYELRYVGKGGERIWTVTSVTPVLGPDGLYAGSVGMALDISDRVRAEHQIRASEARHRSLVEALQEGLLMLQADRTILYANEPFARMIGRPAEEILGRPVESFVAAKSRFAFAAMLTGPPPEHGVVEVVWEHGGGKHIYSLFSLSSSRDEEGRVTGYFAIVTDTTERKALESQLMQSQKLEAIGQLAAGIAHEINTPAQYVGSNVDFIKGAFGDVMFVLEAMRATLLAAKDTPPLPADIEALEALLKEREVDVLEVEVPGAIAETLEGVERISTIVRSMKQFAHPGVAVMAPADLNEAMRSTVTVSRNEWKYVAELEMDLDETLPLVVCMIGEINQVVLNLIVNAAHAIADVLKTASTPLGRIRLSTRHSPPWAEIRVADTGPGIPPEVQAKIFDPFFTTKEVGKGTGQGLTISRVIVVEKHGGQLFFETEPGVGTTFVVRLPLAQTEERAA